MLLPPLDWRSPGQIRTGPGRLFNREETFERLKAKLNTMLPIRLDLYLTFLGFILPAVRRHGSATDIQTIAMLRRRDAYVGSVCAAKSECTQEGQSSVSSPLRHFANAHSQPTHTNSCGTLPATLKARLPPSALNTKWWQATWRRASVVCYSTCTMRGCAFAPGTDPSVARRT